MSGVGRSSLAVSLLVPLLFVAGLAGLLFRASGPAPLPRARPHLATPVELDQLLPMPREPAPSSSAAAVARSDGLRAW